MRLRVRPPGFDLKRKLDKAGVPCVVGAVSKMLRPSGDRVKTDGRDATFLARMLAVGNIVEVAMPTEAMEAARDLARAREDCRHDLMRARHLLSKFLLRKGIVYPGKTAWTKAHREWLRQARIRGPLPARLRGIPREREVARAQARKARQGHRGARRRGGHGPCGLGPEVRQGISTVTAFSIAALRGLLPLPGCTVVHVLRGARAIGVIERGERLARQDHPDGQHPCEDPPRGGGMAARTAPEADVCGSHGRCGGRACRCRRGCRAGEPQASQPCCPSERARQACQRRERRHRARARRVRLGAGQDAPDDAAAALGRSLTNGSFPEARAWLDGAWGNPRTHYAQPWATPNIRHAELPSRKHRNALPNARISDSQSCVESDTPTKTQGFRRTI